MHGQLATPDIRPPPRGSVRRRAGICLLAALLALVNWEWLNSISPLRTTEPIVTGVTINGTRINLECEGRESPTVVVIGAPLVTTLISQAVQEELTRFVRLCTLTVQETATRQPVPGLADVLRGLLIEGKVPGPFAFIAFASESTVSAWVTGPLAPQTAGFVLIDHSPEANSLAITMDGEQWPVPTGETNGTVLAILKLFWPRDEASVSQSRRMPPIGTQARFFGGGPDEHVTGVGGGTIATVASLSETHRPWRLWIAHRSPSRHAPSPASGSVSSSPCSWPRWPWPPSDRR